MVLFVCLVDFGFGVLMVMVAACSGCGLLVFGVCVGFDCGLLVFVRVRFAGALRSIGALRFGLMTYCRYY